MADYPVIYVDGPAKLYIGEANCNATAFVAPGATDRALGFTENGLQVSVNTLTHRVNSDDCGGAEGNPAEILIMGAQGTIRGVMVKYYEDAFADLMSGVFEGSEMIGIPTPLPGTAVFANGYGCSVWAVGKNITYWFPKCEFASQPREFNISTTERKTSFTINAYPVLNATFTGLALTGAGDPSQVYPGCSAVVAGA